MKVLVVDVGNSRVKAGIFVDFYLPVIQSLGNPDDVGKFAAGFEFDGVAVSSVVPSATEALVEAFPRALVLNNGNAGIRIFYMDPETLGPDRIANALYVKYFLSTNCIVADAGTAVTVDPVSANGSFYGGVIFPGPGTQLRALATATSALPETTLSPEPVGPVGRDTVSGMRAGVSWSTALAIEGLARAQANFLGWESYRLLLTGGFAPYVRSILPRRLRCSLEPAASLIGLGAWAQEIMERKARKKS